MHWSFTSKADFLGGIVSIIVLFSYCYYKEWISYLPVLDFATNKNRRMNVNERACVITRMS